MNICFLCDEYPPQPHGGIGTLTQTLGRALVRRGHAVTSLGIYRFGVAEPQFEDDQGVRVIRLPHTAVRGAGVLLNRTRLGKVLQRLHRQTPFDLVDGAESWLANLPVPFAAQKVVRMNGGHHFFMTELGQPRGLQRSLIERWSISRANHLCAVSHYVADVTRRLLGLQARPIEILPNPVDTNRFQPQPGVPVEPGLLMFVGTICEKKGIRQLVQALPQIVAAVPEARLLVYGRDQFDPQLGISFTAHLRTLIPTALTSHIEFMGNLPNAELPQTLARASVCIYPSHMEAQGIVISEGMAMGKAVVASQTGPGPEWIEHEVSGLLCDPYAPASIAQQVIRALQDAALRQRLGEAARRRALEYFSVETLVVRNEAFYERCLH
jgi:glycosyltransferase involved in cell wall biosynthesis